LVTRGALPRDLGAVRWAFNEDGVRAERFSLILIVPLIVLVLELVLVIDLWGGGILRLRL
jgi:hypothetical protein